LLPGLWWLASLWRNRHHGVQRKSELGQGWSQYWCWAG